MQDRSRAMLPCRHVPVMRRRVLCSFLLCAAAMQPVAAQSVWPHTIAPHLRPGARSTFALEGVNLIDPARGAVLVDQVVVVRDGRIVAAGPTTSVAIPGDARRISTRGAWVIPGLIDMHAHLLSDDATADSLAPDELAVMVANGVTHARLTIGTPEHLLLKRAVLDGVIHGPQLVVGSPQLAGRRFGAHFNGYVADTPDKARAAARQAAQDGYDFLKLTFFLSRPVFDAAVEEARTVGLRVVGHVDPQVGLARALEAGMQIEHLDGFLEAILADSALAQGSVSGVHVWDRARWPSLGMIDDAKIARVAGATARAGVWSTPTLRFLRVAFGDGLDVDAQRTAPDARYIPPARWQEMVMARNAFWHAPPNDVLRRRFVDTRNRLVRALADSGARLMAGSDAPDWFFTYGFGVHAELQSLVDAGLSPLEALRAATTAPREWIGVPHATTPFAPGAPADLVILDRNPLDDIGNTTRIRSVVSAGRIIDREHLDVLLARAATRLAGIGTQPIGSAPRLESLARPLQRRDVHLPQQRLVKP